MIINNPTNRQHTIVNFWHLKVSVQVELYVKLIESSLVNSSFNNNTLNDGGTSILVALFDDCPFTLTFASRAPGLCIGV